jgi:hypothetical protein
MSIQGGSLHDSRPDSTFLGDMQELSISRPSIHILSTYYGSLRHSESFGPLPR